MKKNIPAPATITFNKHRLSQRNSKLCGQYCAVLLTSLIDNPELTYSEVLQDIGLSTDLRRNDSIIKKAFQDLVAYSKL